MRCDSCKRGILEEAKKDFILLGKSLGLFNALKCNDCEELFFQSDSFNAIPKSAKEKGLWGITAKRR